MITPAQGRQSPTDLPRPDSPETVSVSSTSPSPAEPQISLVSSQSSMEFLSVSQRAPRILQQMSISSCSSGSFAESLRQRVRIALYRLVEAWSLDEEGTLSVETIQEHLRRLSTINTQELKALLSGQKELKQDLEGIDQPESDFQQVFAEQAAIMAEDNEDLQLAMSDRRDPVDKLYIKQMSVEKRARFALLTLIQFHSEQKPSDPDPDAAINDVRLQLTTMTQQSAEDIAITLQCWPYLYLHLTNPKKIKPELLEILKDQPGASAIDTCKPFLAANFVHEIKTMAQELILNDTSLRQALDPSMTPLQKVTAHSPTPSPSSGSLLSGLVIPWEEDLMGADYHQQEEEDIKSDHEQS